MRDRVKKAKCRCRPARAHRECAYCGIGGPSTHICGACKASGIDGRTIPGTGRVVRAKHKKAKA